MNPLTKLKNSFLSNPYPWLIFISFSLWVFCFRGFLSGQLALTFDAGPYFGHAKFFVYNLAKGVFPLWDPTWANGAPNEFFLRRMGDVNPLYLVMTLLYKLGLPFILTYLWTMTGYFFLGTVGFFKLAQCIFQDKRFAFLAFMLLLFSSLGTRLFDSFIILLFVPLAWFFAFLLSFLKEPNRVACLGATLSFMILMITYIPFYFLTVLLGCLGCLILFYLNKVKNCVNNICQFFVRNKLLSVLCCCFVLMSLYPGAAFYKDSKEGKFVMPVRSEGVVTQNAIEVDLKNVAERGVLEEVLFARYFDLKGMTFKVAYIPVIVLPLILCGLFSPISRRTAFLFTLLVCFFIIGSPQLRLYEFLYENVFFFKLFRNLFFFLWLVLLPAFIFFVISIFQDWIKQKKSPKSMLVHLVLSHWLVLGVFIFSNETLGSSYLTLIGSYILFSWFILKERCSWNFILFGVLVLCVMQPIEVFYHFSDNAFNKRGKYEYEDFSDEFKYAKKEFIKDVSALDDGDLINQKASPFYYATKEFNFLHAHINPNVINSYINHSFILYDQVGQDNSNMLILARALRDKKNLAFVSAFNDSALGFNQNDSRPIFESIKNDRDDFKIMDADVNTIHIKTNFNEPKFLVHTNNFHKDWEVFIDGKKENLYQANIAFKGIALSQGEHDVVLRFGSTWDYFVKYLLMGIFSLVLLWLIVLGQKKALRG